jgi:ribosomal protein S27AE
MEEMKDNKVTTDNYFGGCPQCGESLCVNVRKSHYGICETHKVFWPIGSGLFSSWQEENEEIWRKNIEMLKGFTEVEPIRPAIELGDTQYFDLTEPGDDVEALNVERCEREGKLPAAPTYTKEEEAAELRKLADGVAAFETLGGLDTYDKLAESFIVQIEAMKERWPDASQLSAADRCLMQEIRNHIRLAANSLNWFDPATIRRFYGEMRRWSDEHPPKRSSTRAKKCPDCGAYHDDSECIPF